MYSRANANQENEPENVNAELVRPTRVLFVCLGNICRSPLAEGVMRSRVAGMGLDAHIEVDSAGTGAWHVGEEPDRRMRATAKARGLSIDDLRARQVEVADLYEFDRILAMDRSNYRDLLTFDVPDLIRGRVRLFRDYDPDPGNRDVPDPYYGGSSGFDEVFDIVSRTCDVLLDEIVAESRG